MKRLTRGKQRYRLKGIEDVIHVYFLRGKIKLMMPRYRYTDIAFVAANAEVLNPFNYYWAFDRQKSELIVVPEPDKAYRIEIVAMQRVIL